MNERRVTWGALGIAATVAAGALAAMLWLQRSVQASVGDHAGIAHHAGAASIEDVREIKAEVRQIKEQVGAVQGDVREMRGELRQTLQRRPR